MLAGIRERAGRFIVGAILVLLTIPFALWGIGSYFQPTANTAVAKVGDLEINRGELDRATRETTQRYRELLGESVRPELIDPAAIQQQTLDELIRQKLLELDAGARGLAVSDATLLRTIAANPAFAGEKGFDQERYRRLLGAQGYTPKAFEERVRNALLSDQLRRAIAESTWVSDGELDRLNRLWFEARDIEVAVLARASQTSATPPTDAEIQDFYSRNAAEFQTPSQVRVAYVSVDRARLSEAVTVDADAVRSHYEEHLAQFTTPQRRKLSHILLTVPKDATPEQTRSVEEKVQALRAQLENGADFATLAREHSQDPGSATIGGALGSYTQGALEAPLDQAAFALEAAKVSAPVRSSFGWHLLRVDSITPAQVQSLDAVRGQISRQLRDARANDLLNQQIEELRRVAFEQPDTLEPAAQAVGGAVEQTELFARGAGTGIAANPGFAAAAFADTVLGEGMNSDVIELEPGQYAVLRLLEHIPAATRPLAEVRAAIRVRLADAAAAKAAREAGETILKQLKAGTAREAVTAPGGLVWKSWSGLARDNRSSVDPAVLNAAFKLNRPVDGIASYGGVALESGDYALIALIGVGADPRANDPEQRKALKEALVRARADSALSGYLKQLRAGTSVKVYAQQAD